MTTPALVIAAEPGGCLPATLTCVCGHTALAVWTTKAGAKCDRCERCYKPLVGVFGRPGEYTLAQIGDVTALQWPRRCELPRWQR